jgi:hypothetical protein
MWFVATSPCGVEVWSRFFRPAAVVRQRSEATHRSVRPKGREEDPKMQQVGVHPRWLMLGCRLKMLACSNSLALTSLHHVFFNLHRRPSRGLVVAPHSLLAPSGSVPDVCDENCRWPCNGGYQGLDCYWFYLSRVLFAYF